MTGRARGEERVMMVDTRDEGKLGSVNNAWETTPPMEWATIRTEEGRDGEEG